MSLAALCNLAVLNVYGTNGMRDPRAVCRLVAALPRLRVLNAPNYLLVKLRLHQNMARERFAGLVKRGPSAGRVSAGRSRNKVMSAFRIIPAFRGLCAVAGMEGPYSATHPKCFNESDYLKRLAERSARRGL